MGCVRGSLLVLVERCFGARLRPQPADWCTPALHTACVRASRVKPCRIQAGPACCALQAQKTP